VFSNLSPLGVLGGWMALVTILGAVGIAVGADVSTIALMLAFGVAPAIVTALLACGLPSPSVAEILHSVETKDGRS
jgi:hypothetical protein